MKIRFKIQRIIKYTKDIENENMKNNKTFKNNENKLNRCESKNLSKNIKLMYIKYNNANGKNKINANNGHGVRFKIYNKYKY